jgi:methylthioribose-1-phosphate isomerase
MKTEPGGTPLKVVSWAGNSLTILDQTRLPQQEIYIQTTDYRDVITAIKELKVRGAPAIGVAAGYAAALGALKIKAATLNVFFKEFDKVLEEIASSRPTARNLFWAVERMRCVSCDGDNVASIKERLVNEAVAIQAKETESSTQMSVHGAALIPDNAVILTHCNTGVLATAALYGTALGVILRAAENGKNIRVIATETRPLLQGARLTTWEALRADIPVTLITDSMAGHFLSRGLVTCVIVGADRIAANGDTANKIGTYSLAVLAKENKTPFYVAAPYSTVDLSLATGKEIPIEERNPKEVTHIQGVAIAPEGCLALNPAFDVTPHRYIAAIITEKGVIRKPYGKGLKTLRQA